MCNTVRKFHFLSNQETKILVRGEFLLKRRRSPINPLNTKRRLLYLKIHFVPRSKHFSSRL